MSVPLSLEQAVDLLNSKGEVARAKAGSARNRKGSGSLTNWIAVPAGTVVRAASSRSAAIISPPFDGYLVNRPNRLCQRDPMYSLTGSDVLTYFLYLNGIFPKDASFDAVVKVLARYNFVKQVSEDRGPETLFDCGCKDGQLYRMCPDSLLAMSLLKMIDLSALHAEKTARPVKVGRPRDREPPVAFASQEPSPKRDQFHTELARKRHGTLVGTRFAVTGNLVIVGQVVESRYMPIESSGSKEKITQFKVEYKAQLKGCDEWAPSDFVWQTADEITRGAALFTEYRRIINLGKSVVRKHIVSASTQCKKCAMVNDHFTDDCIAYPSGHMVPLCALTSEGANVVDEAGGYVEERSRHIIFDN